MATNTLAAVDSTALGVVSGKIWHNLIIDNRIADKGNHNKSFWKQISALFKTVNYFQRSLKISDKIIYPKSGSFKIFVSFFYVKTKKILIIEVFCFR